MGVHSDYPLAAHWRHHVRRPPRATWPFSPLLLAERRCRGVCKKVESVLDRPLALYGGSGAALAKPGSGQTVDSVNIPARELGTRPCTRATASSHKGTTRPAEASRNALRPRRSQTTPPRPRGLHSAGALARTHRNKTQPRKAGPLAKKVRQKPPSEY
jgi:hypothetical protein